jgi:hypothetical protein
MLHTVAGAAAGIGRGLRSALGAGVQPIASAWRNTRRVTHRVRLGLADTRANAFRKLTR